jgi:hypothetical protein
MDLVEGGTHTKQDTTRTLDRVSYYGVPTVHIE